MLMISAAVMTSTDVIALLMSLNLKRVGVATTIPAVMVL